MEFIPLFHRQDAVAAKETRAVILFEHNEWGIPPGTYALVESFCTDDACDCRKTMIAMFETTSRTVAATIGYGWENVAYYTKWMYGDEIMGKELAGSYLELGAQQSLHSHAWIAWWKNMIASDERYRDRIREHYRLFKKQGTDVYET